MPVRKSLESLKRGLTEWGKKGQTANRYWGKMPFVLGIKVLCAIFSVVHNLSMVFTGAKRDTFNCVMVFSGLALNPRHQ